jgi:hypothetical protein
MGTASGSPALYVSSAAAWHNPYDHDVPPDALEVEHAGRVCRLEVTRFTCDRPRPAVFLVEHLDGAGAVAFKAAPAAKAPPVER